MDALVMCGGRGTRLGADREKPLVEVAGRPMVERVLGALANSALDRVYAVVSPNAPATRDSLAAEWDLIETAGDGYVPDLRQALADDRIRQPILTVAADLPLLDGGVVDGVLDAHGEGPVTVAVPADLKRELGVSVDTTVDHEGRELAPTGVNVVEDGAEVIHVVDDDRLAVNVNRPTDVDVAERLLGT